MTTWGDNLPRTGGCIAPITYEDGTDGPHRVWLRDEEVPGLAMSRSVGDTIGKKAGVSSEAEITEVGAIRGFGVACGCLENSTVPLCGGGAQVQLTEEDFCIVVATDGLWEFVSNDTVGDIIHRLGVEHGHDEVSGTGVSRGVVVWCCCGC